MFTHKRERNGPQSTNTLSAVYSREKDVFHVTLSLFPQHFDFRHVYIDIELDSVPKHKMLEPT